MHIICKKIVEGKAETVAIENFRASLADGVESQFENISSQLESVLWNGLDSQKFQSL